MIGIVASRLVERFHRPVVLITKSQDGWKGSGRSIATFDLHGALAACSSHLERFGGHRAAAGLSIAESSIEIFAQAFAEQADLQIAPEDLFEAVTVDAVVSAADLTLGLAEELGSPRAVRARQPGRHAARPGGAGRHARPRSATGSISASAFASTDATPAAPSLSARAAQLDRLRAAGLFDVAFRLQENHWNGTVAPQLVVRRIFDTADGYEELRAWLAGLWRGGEASWTPEARRIFGELALDELGSRRRELLESESFRALLLDAGLPRAA